MANEGGPTHREERLSSGEVTPTQATCCTVSDNGKDDDGIHNHDCDHDSMTTLVSASKTTKAKTATGDNDGTAGDDAAAQWLGCRRRRRT